MFTQEENESREEQRLMKTMNKTGSIGRGAVGGKTRPTSWSVNNAGAAPPAKKNEQAQALRELQAQIEKDELAKAPVPEVVNRQTQQSDAATPWDPNAAETHSSRIRAEEDRLNRWMKKTGAKIEPDEGVSAGAEVSLQSSGSIQEYKPPAASPRGASEPEHPPHPAVLAVLQQFQDLVTVSARLIRADNAPALVSELFNIVVIAKQVGEQLPEDSQVISYARALQGAANSLRTKTDSGIKHVANKTEISDALGNLYLQLVAYS